MLTGHSGSNAHFISPPSASMNNKQKSCPMEDRLGIPFPIAVAYCRLHIRDRGEDVEFWYLPPFRLPLPWHFCHPPWLRGTVLVANRVNLSLHPWPPIEPNKLVWCSVDTKGVEHSLQAQVDIEMLFRADHKGCLCCLPPRLWLIYRYSGYAEYTPKTWSYRCRRNATFKLRAPRESRLYRSR